MDKKSRLTISLDADIKEQAAILLQQIGLDFSTAVNMFFKQSVRNERLPLDLSVKRLYSIEEVAGANWREGLSDIEDEWE